VAICQYNNETLSKRTRGEEVTRPWLVISGMALTSSLVSSLNFSVDQGVYVISVVPDSPAADAGLVGAGTASDGNPNEGGDIITAADGQPVESIQELSDYFMTKQVGDNVTLSVIRDGQNLNIQITLAAWPDRISGGIFPRTVPEPDFQLPWGDHFQSSLASLSLLSRLIQHPNTNV
jgi:S1-C subfamily serine protease